MVKKKIYLFRHGQTVYNEKGIFTGWKDSKLNKAGIKHATVIAKKLKNKKFEVAFQTDLSRSKDTLKPVLKYHPECREIITANRMTERNYGIYSGMSHKKFIEKYGQKRYDDVHRRWNVKIPKGENFAQIEKRVAVFIKNLIKFMKKEKVNVAISSHGNSIRLFRKIWEKASIKETRKWFIPYDKVYTYSVDV